VIHSLKFGSSTMTTPKTAQLVIVDYQDVKDTSSSSSLLLQAALEQAFGPLGCGILGISNVPTFEQAKNDLLPLAHRLAHLPPSELTALEDPTSFYNAGWSHGKEQLKPNQPDYAKGSFYFNPLLDVPGAEDDRITYPASYPCNKWPSSSLPELEPAAKHMGKLMKQVAVDLSQHIDAYAHSKNPSYSPTTLYDALVNTEKAKGRLLYYFPLPQSSTEEESTTQDNDDTHGVTTKRSNATEDSWIGWHNDSGFLTALAGDLYVHGTTGKALDPTDIPPEAGLYVMEKQNNEVLKIELPPHCMAIQMGECTQILTGGALVATPHCVRGASSSDIPIARASLACFIDTPPTFPLSVPAGLDRESVIGQQQVQGQQQKGRIPPLEARWTNNGMLFGEFLAQTFQMYYGWSADK
jgi:isopenicillin N synthase-like dioxygenase